MKRFLNLAAYWLAPILSPLQFKWLDHMVRWQLRSGTLLAIVNSVPGGDCQEVPLADILVARLSVLPAVGRVDRGLY